MKRLKPAVVVVPHGEGGQAVDEALEGAGLEAMLRMSLAATEADCWRAITSIVKMMTRTLIPRIQILPKIPRSIKILTG